MRSLGAIVSETYGAMEIGGIAGSNQLLDGVEHKIVDVPDMGYTTQDKPFPRGELVVKTNKMALGYFKNEEETQKAFQDGWYYTGDIVEEVSTGQVRVIDRKKDIFKLAQGEFVSPVRCEAAIQQSKFIEQSCVYGDSLRSYLVAVVVPNEGVLRSWFDQDSTTSFADMCQHENVVGLLLGEIEQCSVHNKVCFLSLSEPLACDN
jgi:long-subunit acyl-CoA synthetase (AMP-forming)